MLSAVINDREGLMAFVSDRVVVGRGSAEGWFGQGRETKLTANSAAPDGPTWGTKNASKFRGWKYRSFQRSRNSCTLIRDRGGMGGRSFSGSGECAREGGESIANARWACAVPKAAKAAVEGSAEEGSADINVEGCGRPYDDDLEEVIEWVRLRLLGGS